MRQSKLFTKTRKDAPTDEVSKNAELLIRGGYIHKEMAGVYSYLPLGLLVLKKIENIIREEMNAIGATELILTALQKREVWEKVGRWDDGIVDVWFKTKLKDNMELGLGFTHDEQLVNLLTEYISSYNDLPLYVYQIQTKFRNELRAKSGIMRGREFVMKDLYSFNRTEEDQDKFYEEVKKAYMKVYTRCGIGHRTYVTFASGGTFSQFSHEFQTVSEAGEDTIYVAEDKGIAINEEVLNNEVLAELGVEKKDLVLKKSVEVGNIFKQGTKYTDPFGLHYNDEKGQKKSIFMGGYGIGVTRLMGTVVEVLSDDKGIIWPQSIAPFTLHLLALGDDATVFKEADKVYKSLLKMGVEVLFDDRKDMSAGEKFSDSDLLGIPWRAVISGRSLKEKGIELKKRTEEKGKIISLTSIDELINMLTVKA
jgi:prolyl-tRNA synthetase